MVSGLSFFFLMVDLILQQFKCRKAKYRIVCLIIIHNQFSFEAWIYFILC